MTNKTYHFRAIDKLGAVVSTWLLVAMISDAVGVASTTAEMMLFSRPGMMTQAETDIWWMVIGLLSVAQIIVYFAVVVLVARWIYRASANLHANGRKLTTPPGWAVGWYFIPFANLWKPYQAMEDIAHHSIGTSKTLPLPLWWAFWIVSNIAGNISFRLSLNATDATAVTWASGLAIVSSVAGIGAALALRVIVRRVTEGQSIDRRVEVF